MQPNKIPILAIVAIVAVLAGCSSPPKVPTVDGSERRPINDDVTFELMQTRRDLANTQKMLKAKDAELRAQEKLTQDWEMRYHRDVVAVAHPAEKVTPVATAVPTTAPAFPIAKQIFTFSDQQLEFSPTEEQAAALKSWASVAKRIQVKAFSDAEKSTPDSVKQAKQRVSNTRNWLAENTPIKKSQVKVTYSSFGQFLEDNSNPTGKAKNRRVEMRFSK